MIYFMRWEEGGLIKIGSTASWSRRRKEYSNASTGRNPILIGVMDGSKAEERKLHRRFAHLRVNRRKAVSEWFHPGDDLVNFIVAESRPWLESDDAANAAQPNVLSIRGSLEWRDWLQGYAKHRRTTPTGVIDLAIAEMAKRDKYPAPPQRVP